jgi:hypothetical protein
VDLILIVDLILDLIVDLILEYFVMTFDFGGLWM